MKKVVIYFLAMVFIQLVCGIAVPLVWNAVTGHSDMSVMQLIVSSSVASVLTIILFVLAKWTPYSRDFIQRRPWYLLFWCIAIGFGMLIPTMFLEELIPEQLTKDILADQFKMIMGNSWGYLAVGLLAPFAEELVFRGAIQKAAIGFFKKNWIGIAFTALLFAAIHGNPAQMPHAFLVGLLLGWMCYRSGSIVPGIVVHWVNNTTAFVLYARYPQTYDMTAAELFGNNMQNIAIVISLSLIILAAGLYQYHQLTKKSLSSPL